MKVLLDEMLPIGVRELLSRHDVSTAAYAGLAGLPNGELISRAVAAGFDVIGRAVHSVRGLAGSPWKAGRLHVHRLRHPARS